MQETTPVANPFALMMNPEAVLQALARSDRLERLQRRICRPLDKPVIAKAEPDAEEFDKSVDAQAGSESDH
ncbi:MAG: hypothetical protein M9915_04170 [Rhizobacter sp.]|nr:hypothetical protein [Burkholderiaceae bacterium]MCO5122923.1 hypothetical protein [Rhizobacter sp.]